MSVDATNRAALEAYRKDWGSRAVASGKINPRFYDTYKYILTKQIPTITGKASFDTALADLVQTIKQWYVNAGYSGNLAQLAAEIDRTRPAFNDGTTAPPPAPAPVPAGNADCLSNGRLTLALNQYQSTCANTPQVNEVRNKFFTTEPNASVNFKDEFDTLRSLAQADIQDIDGLLSGTTKNEVFVKIVEKLRAQKEHLAATLAATKAKVDATNQQFLDDRASAGEINKTKVNVLQDYILAAFTISWIFLIVVVVIYITKTSETPIKSLISSSVLGIIVSAVLYTWVMAIA